MAERSLDLLQLYSFHAVAMHGGFSAASRTTRTPKATLSRRVLSLERSLGVRLFERGPRALRLTDEGEALQSRTETTLAELTEASDEIAGRAGTPRGRLRISVPGYFAQNGFGEFAARYVANYPEVVLEIVVQDNFVDPIADGFDIVIRVNPDRNSLLVGKKLFEDRFLLAARPDVLKPTSKEYVAPAVVLLGRPLGESWTFDDGHGIITLKLRPVLRLASMVLIRDAVLAGAGVGLLPESIARPAIEAGLLVAWGKLMDRTIEVWVLHASRQLRSAKTGAFIDMLTDTFARR